MPTLTENQQWLLEQAKADFAERGIPADVTVTSSGASMRDQQVVRDEIAKQVNGVRS